MSQPTLDSDGLPTTSDGGRYRDLIWRLSSDPDDRNGIVLDRIADDRAAFAAQNKRGLGSPPEQRSRFRLDEFQSMRRGEEWPHIPVQSGTADAIGKALRDALPREALADLGFSAGLAVRLKIVCGSRGAGDAPWELLAGPNGPLVLDGFHVVRDVPVRYPTPGIQITPPLRVAIVVSGPSAKEHLDVDTEIETVRPTSSWYQTDVIVGASADSVMRQLRESAPQVVHIVGHAAKSQREGFAILADERNGPSWTSAASLAAMLPPSVRLLCLDTCISNRNYDIRGLARLAQAPASLPMTITSGYAVTQPGAAAFWSGFYDHLAKDGNVVEAVCTGRRTSLRATTTTADWGSYALYQRGAAAILFETVATHSSRDEGRDHGAQYMLRLANELAVASGTLPPEAAEQLLAESAAVAHDYVRLSGEYSLTSAQPRVLPLEAPYGNTHLTTSSPRIQTLKDEPDERLLSLFQSGDSDAFETLIDRHKEPVLNFILRRTGDKGAAEDLLQETFMHVASHGADYRGHAKFKTWLYVIAWNICARQMKGRRFRGRVAIGLDRDGGPYAVASDGEALKEEVQISLERAIAALPQDQRDVFLLREYDDMPFGQIARLAGVSEPTARSRMRDALEKMQRAIDDLHGVVAAVDVDDEGVAQ